MILKALLGLVISNQYCQGAMKLSIVKLVLGDFFLARKTQTSMIPNIQYCMIKYSSSEIARSHQFLLIPLLTLSRFL